MRLFVAIGLDPAHRAVLARLPAPKAQRRVRLRFVPERNLHLTLRFLGEQPESRIPELTERLFAATREVGRFKLRCAGLGCFPPRGPPRVLFAGCTGLGGDAAPELERLKRRIDTELEAVGFPPEERPFHAHVTLARIDRMKGRPREALVDPELAGRCFFVQPVTAVLLMRSELRPDGAVHRVVAELKLADGNVAGGGLD